MRATRSLRGMRAVQNHFKQSTLASKPFSMHVATVRAGRLHKTLQEVVAESIPYIAQQISSARTHGDLVLLWSNRKVRETARRVPLLPESVPNGYERCRLGSPGNHKNLARCRDGAHAHGMASHRSSFRSTIQAQTRPNKLHVTDHTTSTEHP